MSKRPIAFDLDGTLLQTHLEALPAYADAFDDLIAKKIIETGPNQERIKGLFGMTSDEVWPYLMPQASDEVRAIAAQAVKEARKKYKGRAKLYPGVLETLTELADRGHPLFVVSNGVGHHVTGTCNRFQLTPLLTGIYAAGDYETDSKVKLLKSAVQEFTLSPGVMVGDRDSDMEAGAGNGFVTVGCTYGFGQRQELVVADYLIDDIRELIELIDRF